jgi:hypothetical protein
VTTNSSGKKGRTERALAALATASVAMGWAVAGCGGATAESPGKPPLGVSTVSMGPEVDFKFDSIDDRPVNAEATRGKPTVLAFVTTSSLGAQAQVDFLIAMAKHDAAQVNYAVVALEANADRELVELYKKSLAIPFPVAMSDVATRAGAGPFGDVSAVPVTVLLDRAGRVVWRVEGRVAKSAEIRAAMHGL